MGNRNYYDLLRVSRRSTRTDIETAREKTLENHSSRSHTTLKEIHEAFHHLSDPARRREYDFMLDHPVQMKPVLENEISLERRTSAAFFENPEDETSVNTAGFSFVVMNGFHSYAFLLGKISQDDHAELEINTDFSVITLQQIQVPFLLEIVKDMQQSQLMLMRRQLNQLSLQKLKTAAA